MKKFTAIAASALIIIFLFLSGCGDKTKKEISPAVSGIECEADIAFGDYRSRCALKIYGGGLFLCTALSPESIAGCEARFDGDTLKIIYNGLEYVPELPLPVDNLSCALDAVIKSIISGAADAKPDGDRFRIDGRAGEREYTLFVSESGYPLRLEADGLSADFYNVTLIK